MALGRKMTANGTILDFDDGDDGYSNEFMAGMATARRRKKRSKNKRNARHTRRHHTSSSKKRRSRTSSRGRIKYTRKGQPYIITSSGRAKFIKKRR